MIIHRDLICELLYGPSQATALEIHLSFHDESRMASSSMYSTLRATHPLRKASQGPPHLCLMPLQPRHPSRDLQGHQRECTPLMLLEQVRVPTGLGGLVGGRQCLCRNQADKIFHFDPDSLGHFIIIYVPIYGKQ